jgi:hypothetical protein
MARARNVNYVHVLVVVGCVYIAIRTGWMYAMAYGAAYYAGYMNRWSRARGADAVRGGLEER